MRDDKWYQNLKKAPWNPKPHVFSIVWTILYIMMSIALYLVWSNKKCYPYCSAIKVFFIQLLLNLIWTTIFFRLKMPILAFIDIIAIIIGVCYTYKEFMAIDKTAGMLLIPYICWLFVAFSLNGYIIVMN